MRTGTLLLALSLATGAATAGTPADPRTPIPLPAKMKARILTDMRANLEAVQGMVEAAAKGDLARVAKAATPHARMADDAASRRRHQMLPAGFIAIGDTVNAGYRAIIRDAKAGGTAQHATQQIGELLNRCNAYHAVYRLGQSSQSIR